MPFKFPQFLITKPFGTRDRLVVPVVMVLEQELGKRFINMYMLTLFFYENK